MRRTAALVVALASTALAGTPSFARASDGALRSFSEGRAPPPDAEFVRLAPPRPGDWRSVFPEPVQTLAEYRRSAGRAVRFEKRTIRLLPLGASREGDAELLSALREFLGGYFMTRVELEPGRAVPDEVPRRASRGFGRQVFADDLLRAFSAAQGGRLTVARLAVTPEDLYASSGRGGHLNFVFGLGSRPARAAVCSYARYSLRYPGEPEGATVRRRAFKLAAHELAHVFGLAHCRTYSCCMNGSNSIAESDARPVHLCPDCLEKLAYHFRLDGLERALRFRALEKVYRKLGWKAEADFAARRGAAETASAPRRTPARSDGRSE